MLGARPGAGAWLSDMRSRAQGPMRDRFQARARRPFLCGGACVPPGAPKRPRTILGVRTKTGDHRPGERTYEHTQRRNKTSQFYATIRRGLAFGDGGRHQKYQLKAASKFGRAAEEEAAAIRYIHIRYRYIL